MTMTGLAAEPGIPGDIALGLICAVLAAFYLAMIRVGIATAVTEPAEPRHQARHRRQPG